MSSYEIPAAELTAKEIGKTVRVGYTHGQIESNVTDELTQVLHKEDRGVTKVVLFFRKTQWVQTGLLSMSGDLGLTVPVDTVVEVNP